MNAVLAVLLASMALAASGADPPKKPPKKKPSASLDGWDSLKMEGAAVLGELKLQSGDYSGAEKTFDKSIETSTQLRDPSSPVMALDLYRSALLAASKGNVEEARNNLDILLSRYPESEFVIKARQLQALIDRGDKALFQEEEGVELEPMTSRPGSRLSGLRAALAQNRWRDALGLAREFSAANPRHELAPEARLLEGLLTLSIQPAKAAPVLTPLARGGPSNIRSRAAYALGAAASAMHNCSWVQEDIPDPTVAKKDRWQTLGLIWQAACDEQAGRGDAAVRKYETVALSPHASPARAYALAALGAARERGGDFKGSLELMDKAISEAESFGLKDVTAAAALNRGHLLYKMKRLRDAAQTYQAFAGAYPSDPNRTLALYQRGLALKWAGDRREAIAAFESLLARHPDTVYAPDARLQLGQLYGEAGDSRKAVDSYRRMAEAGRDGRRESLLLEAQHHYNRKAYSAAIPLYWKFLSEFPNDPRRKEVGTLLLTCYWMGDKENPDFVKAAELFPDHPIVANLRWNLAAQAHRQGQCQAAVALFDRFEAEYPRSPRMEEGLLLKGECLYELRDFRGAAASFQDLVQRFPKSPRTRDAMFKRGLALHEAGDYEASVASLRLVKGKDKLAEDAAYNVVLADMKTGDNARLLASLERLVKDFPAHRRAGWAWLRIGELRETAGRWAEAAAAYEKAAENRAQALFSAGRCYERLKKRAAARKAYEALRRLRPADNPHRLSGLARLGLFYELQRQPRKAAQVYADILKNAPQGELLELARKRLLALTKDGSLTAPR